MAIGKVLVFVFVFVFDILLFIILLLLLFITVSILKKFKVDKIENMPWNILSPNIQGDWISQRNDIYMTFIPMGEKIIKNHDSVFWVNFSFIRWIFTRTFTSEIPKIVAISA